MSLSNRLARLAAAVTAAAIALLLAPTTAGARTNDAPELRIRPVGQSESSYFDVQAAPGETLALQVEISNAGDAPARARTYAADAYTIVNGGFGLELFGDTTAGATNWLDYPTEVVDLAPGQSIVREVVVRVPPDASAGEHIAGLAVENADAVRGSGPVRLDAVVRKALAVLVTLPGDIDHAFDVTAAEHLVVGGRSVVAIDLVNTGTALVRPRGTVTVTNAAGAVVAQPSVAMDSVYAGTRTRLEVALAERLAPGPYSIAVALEDSERGGGASAPDLRFEVDAPAAPPVRGDTTNRLTERLPRAVRHALPAEERWGSLAAAAATVVLGAGLAIALRRRHGQAGRARSSA